MLRHTRPPAQAFARWGGVLTGILQVFVLGGAMPSDRVRTYVPDRRFRPWFVPSARTIHIELPRPIRWWGLDHPLNHPRAAAARERSNPVSGFDAAHPTLQGHSLPPTAYRLPPTDEAPQSPQSTLTELSECIVRGWGLVSRADDETEPCLTSVRRESDGRGGGCAGAEWRGGPAGP